ncbi:DALR anticodon-binding domain-containing protein [Lichenicoccus roseus]|uniref:Arginyl tRNA synthetase N-terminal domain-containing protein n=1 Tax=Lichenicoccus roseus TaxID=2683649 RepID=A0A5R9J4B5_9PROT|nr:DALR anticodon-binding domain-containing protein [Lichenicoccus roseus]TLU72465.1 hypothetical protein FE263_10370 [Lichenicoccus roseus]
MAAILSHPALIETIREVVPLAPAAGRMADIRMWRSRRPRCGDVSTDAALVLAGDAGRPAVSLAGEVAARLGMLPAIDDAAVSGPGFINLTFADDALARLLPRLLAKPAGAGRPAPVPWLVPPGCMDLRDFRFRIQYMHARCASVVRAAAEDPAAGWIGELARIRAGRIASTPTGIRRTLLCELEQGCVLLDPAAPPVDRHRVWRWLGALSEVFEAVWDESGLHATLGLAVRALEQAQADRALVDLALMLATADAVQAGLWCHGMTAAEEIR